MNLSAFTFVIFLIYFLFSALANSTFIVITQSLYEYGVDDGESSILQTLENLFYLLTAYFLAPLLIEIGFKRLLFVLTVLVTLLAFLMPIGTNFWIPKLFYAIIGLGLAASRLIGYKAIQVITTNTREFSSMVNFFEGLFLLAAVISFATFGFLSSIESFPWRYAFWLFGSIGVLCVVLLVKSDSKNIDENIIFSIDLKNYKDVFKTWKSTISMMQYTLVFFFILILLLLVLCQYQHTKWYPLFCKEVLHLTPILTDQLLIIVAFGGFLGRLVASILLRTTNSVFLLIFCLVSVMVILFLITYIVQHNYYTTTTSWQSMPTVIWLLPLLSFFWFPLQPTLFAIVISNVKAEKYTSQLNMLGLLMVLTVFFEWAVQPISNYIFSMFSVSVAFFVSIIFVLILLIVIILFLNDLKKTA
ncbi:MAG: MFS transporter [Thermoflexibacteraceae bacterium]|jgi:FHS family glucose/mannose:H+ symporter-like MFS transporter